ncbi:MAG: SDR family NAD(P)-dependent oxidoreductase [Rhodospirillaceae bacterium]|nr:SDR family NAD(P)-dependent oxidoreductase [Rhodospirillaceae bacterium]
MKNPHSILITGASSGIGEALALHYARPGAFLALTGRDAGRTEAVAAACRSKGADAVGETVDATDAAAMADFVTRMHARTPLDLVVANAGISAGTGGAGEPPEQARRILAVNVTGVINTVGPAVACLQAKPRPADGPRGQIAIMASLASFRGFPGAPAYCASKAAVRIWGEGLRGVLHAEGIEISVICPGYVRSRMTARNKFRMPLLMDANRAARIVARGLARNRGRIAFPWRLYALVMLISALPPGLIDPLLRRLPRKGAD